jgi:hypothetical protein
MGLAKGIEAVRKAQKEVEKRKASGGGSDNFYLKYDKDSALIRFLNDGNDMVAGQFHRIKKMSSRGKQYWDSVYCIGEDECDYCNGNDPDQMAKSFGFAIWVWVYEKYHEEQLDEDWEARKMAGELRYVEPINKPMLLRHGYNMSIIVTGLYTKYGSLVDRDYEITRLGTGLDTKYSILPEDKSKRKSEVKKAMDSIGEEGGLPTLEEAVMATVKKDEDSIDTEESEDDEVF